jgi:glycosyltransferase involved in cell wall biosynthesis
MVTTFYPPFNFGGDGVAVERLSHALANDGHEVHVLHDRDAYEFCSRQGKFDSAPAPGENDRELGSDNGLLQAPSSPPDNGKSDGAAGTVRIHTLGDGNIDMIDLLARHQLGRPVKRKAEIEQILGSGFDVIHFHNISLMGGPEILKLGNGVKLCTLHDHWFVCGTHVLWRYNQEACTRRTCFSCTLASKRPPQMWRYTDAVAQAAKHVNAFIAPSEFAKQSHKRNGFPADIRVLPHFIPDDYLIDPAKAQSADNDQTASSARGPSRPYFLFVGRLEKLKGVQFLIEVFRNYEKADLVVVGTGNYAEELRAQAANLSHIHFTGRIDKQKLRPLYKNALAAIVPSLTYETFGLTAVESFACGTPVLVNDLGALPEVIKDGGGLKYETAEELTQAMERLRTDKDYRKKLVREAYENLKANYTQQRHLKQYYDMILELMHWQGAVSAPAGHSGG